MGDLNEVKKQTIQSVTIERITMFLMTTKIAIIIIIIIINNNNNIILILIRII